jgi:AraC-like DNA-binding protein
MPDHGLTAPIAPEDGYLAVVQLADCQSRELWLDGKAVQTWPLASGDVVFHDLHRNPILNFRSPFHALCFYLPRVSLDSITDDANAPRIGALDYHPGIGMQDPTMFELGRLLLPAFPNPEQASRLFIDHLTLAIAAHVLQAYGGMRPVSSERRGGGLAPWQERRAKDLLNAHLDGDLSVAFLAQECGLSKGHFARAFRRTTGLSPHQWLMKLRVEMATALLGDRSRSLLNIAHACGFADQSHFTRVYTRFTGTTPGASRRQHGPTGAGVTAAGLPSDPVMKGNQ